MAETSSRPNFAEFAYSIPEADERVIDDIVAARVKTYELTGFGSDVADQRLGTYVSTPPELKGPELVVRATAFSDDNGRESGAYFDALIAHGTGRRVIAVNAPGVEYKDYLRADNDSHLSPEQAEAAQELTPDQIEFLKKGSFQKTGEASMVALFNAAQVYEATPRFIVISSSMGSAQTAGKVRAAAGKGYDIAGVSFAEIVNTIDRVPRIGSMPVGPKWGKILPQFAGGMGLAPQYTEHNPAVLRRHDTEKTGGWARRVVNDTRANSLYAGALAQPGFYDDLGDVEHLEGRPVLLTRGAASELSPVEQFGRLSRAFTGTALNSITYGDQNNPHDHPYTMTVGYYVAAVKDNIERAA